jgi:amino acid transporter
MNVQVWRLLFGRPLSTVEQEEQSIGARTGVPVLGLDALASAAYGPEAALTVLIPAGLAGVRALGPITIAIVVLLAILYFSYRQTIAVYPDGGGAYTVARRNFGERGAVAGLIAASALGVDYILNVAVAISAGVAAVASAVPALSAHRLTLCLGLLVFLTLMNLRGLRSTGLAFAIPTYVYVASLLSILAFGLVKSVAAGGHPIPVAPPPALKLAGGSVTLWLIARAFASGCTAMTGVEAVSNAVPAFRPPAVTRARWTLTAIVAILIALVSCEAVLCRAYHVGATEPGSPHFESVLSQLVGAVVGRGWFYCVTIAAVFSVLCLSANTSFADFPRLCRVLAQDRLLPPRFAHRGRRLAYTRGILLLSTCSAALLVVFGGVTDRLIPLFAIGAFLAFTMSQLGMVLHWHRAGPARGKQVARVMNAVGAAATASALLIIVVSKFTEGAWIPLLLVPAIVIGLWMLGRWYARIDREVASTEPLTITPIAPPVIIVPIERLDRVTRRALQLALRVSPDVQAVQLLNEPDLSQPDLAACWDSLVRAPAIAAGRPAPKLTVIETKYRELVGPLLEHVDRVAAVYPDRDVAVLISELVARHWHYRLLRGRRATLLKEALLLRGAPRVVLIDAPWRLQ